MSLTIKKQIGIIVISFNRTKSLTRLLNSLKNANYYGDIVDLTISIDYSGDFSVYDVATLFEWPFGEKIIIQHKENLGLRKHVLFCGGLSEKYENICVFEDDIFVSPSFYNFAKTASEFYENDHQIAGISLYNHKWNYIADRPFEPISSGYDMFLMQQAQSWGQVWNRKKWKEFIKWYEKNSSNMQQDDDFPKSIYNWPKSSWLKYHMKYLVENNKFFIYPQNSLTSNFSDIGTHASISSTKYQVPLDMSADKKYNFLSSKINVMNRYDIFFENIYLYENLGYSKSELTIDLYGKKQNFNKYLLSSKEQNFRIIKSFGLKLRPHELNVIFEVEGKSIFLYDTSIVENNKKEKYFVLNKFIYDTRTSEKNTLMNVSLHYYYEALKTLIRNVLKKIS